MTTIIFIYLKLKLLLLVSVMATSHKRERLSILMVLITPLVLILGAPLVMTRVEPFVLGMPFNLFWHIFWMVFGAFLLTIAYLIRTRE